MFLHAGASLSWKLVLRQLLWLYFSTLRLVELPLPQAINCHLLSTSVLVSLATIMLVLYARDKDVFTGTKVHRTPRWTYMSSLEGRQRDTLSCTEKRQAIESEKMGDPLASLSSSSRYRGLALVWNSLPKDSTHGHQIPKHKLLPKEDENACAQGICTRSLARERPRPSEDFIPFLSWLPWSRAHVIVARGCFLQKVKVAHDSFARKLRAQAREQVTSQKRRKFQRACVQLSCACDRVFLARFALTIHCSKNSQKQR